MPDDSVHIVRGGRLMLFGLARIEHDNRTLHADIYAQAEIEGRPPVLPMGKINTDKPIWWTRFIEEGANFKSD